MLTHPPLTDAHIHLWDPRRLSYPWLEAHPSLNRLHGLTEFDEARGGTDVEGFVFVQCDAVRASWEAETRWVQSLAESDHRVRGIVAFAPLEMGDAVRPCLESLRGIDRVRGVRRLLQSEPDAGFCLRPGFLEGVAALADYGLRFDICIYHHQLPAVIEMVERTPEVTFILDHIAKPDIRAGRLDPWREQLRRLADYPNVACKISGLVTEADHEHWRPDELCPYVEHTLECFGFDRVMFGSDWPVVTLATAYPRWVETLREMVAGCDASDQRKLFHDNAVRWYGL